MHTQNRKLGRFTADAVPSLDIDIAHAEGDTEGERQIADGAFGEILHSPGSDVVRKRVFDRDSGEVLVWEYEV